MGLLREIKRRAGQAAGPLAGCLVVGYFVFHAVEGDRGVVAWHRLDQRIAESRAMLDGLEAERHVLERRVALLSPQSLDLDMLEERARIVLNYGRVDEVVVLTPGRGEPPRPRDSAPAGDSVHLALVPATAD